MEAIQKELGAGGVGGIGGGAAAAAVKKEEEDDDDDVDWEEAED